MLPRIVVYDPVLTISMPPELTAASGMNALAHAVESLYAPDGTPQSSDVAEEAIRALAHGLPRAVASRMILRPVARRCGARGSPAGLSAAPRWVCSTSLPMCSAAHISCRTPARHSACCHTVARVQCAGCTRSRSAELARALGSSGPERGWSRVVRTRHQLQAPTSLADLGLEADAIEAVAEIVVGSPGLQSPRLHEGEMSVT